MAKIEGPFPLTEEERSKIMTGCIYSPEEEVEPHGIMKRIKKQIQKALKK